MHSTNVGLDLLIKSFSDVFSAVGRPLQPDVVDSISRSCRQNGIPDRIDTEQLNKGILCWIQAAAYLQQAAGTQDEPTALADSYSPVRVPRFGASSSRRSSARTSTSQSNRAATATATATTTESSIASITKSAADYQDAEAVGQEKPMNADSFGDYLTQDGEYYETRNHRTNSCVQNKYNKGALIQQSVSSRPSPVPSYLCGIVDGASDVESATSDHVSDSAEGLHSSAVGLAATSNALMFTDVTDPTSGEDTFVVPPRTSITHRAGTTRPARSIQVAPTSPSAVSSISNSTGPNNDSLARGLTLLPTKKSSIGGHLTGVELRMFNCILAARLQIGSGLDAMDWKQFQELFSLADYGKSIGTEDLEDLSEHDIEDHHTHATSKRIFSFDNEAAEDLFRLTKSEEARLMVKLGLRYNLQDERRCFYVIRRWVVNVPEVNPPLHKEDGLLMLKSAKKELCFACNVPFEEAALKKHVRSMCDNRNDSKRFACMNTKFNVLASLPHGAQLSEAHDHAITWFEDVLISETKKYPPHKIKNLNTWEGFNKFYMRLKSYDLAKGW